LVVKTHYKEMTKDFAHCSTGKILEKILYFILTNLWDGEGDVITQQMDFEHF